MVRIACGVHAFKTGDDLLNDRGDEVHAHIALRFMRSRRMDSKTKRRLLVPDKN